MYEKTMILENDEITPINEAMIAIPVRVFARLIKAEERIEAVERTYNACGYFCSDDVLAILGIEKKEKEEND